MRSGVPIRNWMERYRILAEIGDEISVQSLSFALGGGLKIHGLGELGTGPLLREEANGVIPIRSSAEQEPVFPVRNSGQRVG